jgi:hypothetical protein
MKKFGLTGNQLKLLAVITMTIDHVGAHLFPTVMWLRIIGRLAFPIYAYMIAEGCHHTRSMPRYLLSVAGMAALCQGVLYLFNGSLHMYILVTFTMSILLILLLQLGQRNAFFGILSMVAVGAAYYITQKLPGKLPGDFRIDYDFMGVLLPVMIWAGKDKWQSLSLCAAGLLLMGMGNDIQMYALLALIPLALYNGNRGSARLKAFFYWYYPVHLVAIYAIGYVLEKIF